MIRPPPLRPTFCIIARRGRCILSFTRIPKCFVVSECCKNIAIYKKKQKNKSSPAKGPWGGESEAGGGLGGFWECQKHCYLQKNKKKQRFYSRGGSRRRGGRRRGPSPRRSRWCPAPGASGAPIARSVPRARAAATSGSTRSRARRRTPPPYRSATSRRQSTIAAAASR